MHRFVGLLGIAFVIGMCVLFSTNRRAIRYKIVAWGLGLQVALAFLVIKWSFGQLVFNNSGAGAKWLLDFSYYGSSFVFGDLGQQNSPRGLFSLPGVAHHHFHRRFFCAAHYYGIMQVIVKVAARVMTRLMGASGAESLNVAASIFIGQTEAPLTIRPFLPEVTRSELMTIMTSGMAHVSGSMMGAIWLTGSARSTCWRR